MRLDGSFYATALPSLVRCRLRYLHHPTRGLRLEYRVLDTWTGSPEHRVYVLQQDFVLSSTVFYTAGPGATYTGFIPAKFRPSLPVSLTDELLLCWFGRCDRKLLVYRLTSVGSGWRWHSFALFLHTPH